MIVTMLGPPGAGKGTQAARLAGALGLVHLSAGDMLRAERSAETELGDRVASYMDAGALVPDGLILDAVLARVQALPEDVVLDGFPRTIGQAKQFDDRLDEIGSRRIEIALSLMVPDDIASARLANRSRGRSDDSPDIIRARIETYHEFTEPLAMYYQGQGILAEVDGHRSADEVFISLLVAYAKRGDEVVWEMS